jgi:hypothetical protein
VGAPVFVHVVCVAFDEPFKSVTLRWKVRCGLQTLRLAISLRSGLPVKTTRTT